MTRSAAEVIGGELDPGEQLLWTGQPPQGLRLRASDAFLIPFSLAWCGFALYWEYSVIRGGAPLLLIVWGIPFILSGLYLTIARFFVDARHRARTWYGLSNERVIIVTGLLVKRVKSLNLRTLGEVTLIEGKSGDGTISFGHLISLTAWLNVGWWPGAEQFLGPRFERIANAKQVLQRIREAQRHAA